MGKIIGLFLSVFCVVAWAHNYKYSDLIIKDYDEMNQQVQARIKKARKLLKSDSKASPTDTAEEEVNPDAIAELVDALKLIFSRPNTDNMVAKLTPDVRRELSNVTSYEEAIAGIAKEAIAGAQDKGGTVARRSTSLFMLENILSEIRPEVPNNEEFRTVVKTIADAKLKIDDDVANERKVRSMFKTRNPSEMASEILAALTSKKKK